MIKRTCIGLIAGWLVVSAAAEGVAAPKAAVLPNHGTTVDTKAPASTAHAPDIATDGLDVFAVGGDFVDPVFDENNRLVGGRYRWVVRKSRPATAADNDPDGLAFDDVAGTTATSDPTLFAVGAYAISIDRMATGSVIYVAGRANFDPFRLANTRCLLRSSRDAGATWTEELLLAGPMENVCMDVDAVNGKAVAVGTIGAPVPADLQRWIVYQKAAGSSGFLPLDLSALPWANAGRAVETAIDPATGDVWVGGTWLVAGEIRAILARYRNGVWEKMRELSGTNGMPRSIYFSGNEVYFTASQNVFGNDLAIVYRGAIDRSRPAQPVTWAQIANNLHRAGPILKDPAGRLLLIGEQTYPSPEGTHWALDVGVVQRNGSVKWTAQDRAPRAQPLGAALLDGNLYVSGVSDWTVREYILGMDY